MNRFVNQFLCVFSFIDSYISDKPCCEEMLQVLTSDKLVCMLKNKSEKQDCLCLLFQTAFFEEYSSVKIAGGIPVEWLQKELDMCLAEMIEHLPELRMHKTSLSTLCHIGNSLRQKKRRNCWFCFSRKQYPAYLDIDFSPIRHSVAVLMNRFFIATGGEYLDGGGFIEKLRDKVSVLKENYAWLEMISYATLMQHSIIF